MTQYAVLALFKRRAMTVISSVSSERDVTITLPSDWPEGLVAAEAEDDDPQMAYSLWCALGGNEYETIDYDEAGLALPGVRHGTLPYADDDWGGDSQSDEEGSVRGEDEYYMSEL